MRLAATNSHRILGLTGHSIRAANHENRRLASRSTKRPTARRTAPARTPCVLPRRDAGRKLQMRTSPRTGASRVQLLPRHPFEVLDVIRAEGEARRLKAGLEVSRGDAQGGVEARPGGQRIALRGCEARADGFALCVPRGADQDGASLAPRLVARSFGLTVDQGLQELLRGLERQKPEATARTPGSMRGPGAPVRHLTPNRRPTLTPPFAQ